jgi:hypothetical protein
MPTVVCVARTTKVCPKNEGTTAMRIDGLRREAASDIQHIHYSAQSNAPPAVCRPFPNCGYHLDEQYCSYLNTIIIHPSHESIFSTSANNLSRIS